MGEKYGIASSQKMDDVLECDSYIAAVRLAAASGKSIVVFYAHGQWWF